MPTVEVDVEMLKQCRMVIELDLNDLVECGNDCGEDHDADIEMRSDLLEEIDGVLSNSQAAAAAP